MNIVHPNTQYPDQVVIEKILQGETSMFEILIRRYNPYLHKTGMSFGFSHEDTQDLMQESFVNAFFHLSSFENRSSFKTWLIRIMIRQCLRKKQKWDYQHEVNSLIHEKSEPMFSTPHAQDPNAVVHNKELKEVIEQALLRLPEPYRIVFLMREMNEMSSKETAETLAISETNVKVRLHRARILLRKEIEKTYTPEDLFEFHLRYCDLMVERVMGEIAGRSN